MFDAGILVPEKWLIIPVTPFTPRLDEQELEPENLERGKRLDNLTVGYQGNSVATASPQEQQVTAWSVFVRSVLCYNKKHPRLGE